MQNETTTGNHFFQIVKGVALALCFSLLAAVVFANVLRATTVPDKAVYPVNQTIKIVAVSIGTLVFGLGLTCILEWQKLALGAVLSLVGIVPVALAYPLYRLWLEKRKRKYSAEILSLSEKMLHR